MKPANIKITPDGVVKLLDFGLAKANEEASAASSSMSPTMSLAMTQAGMILGTAAYMSPEQARGKPVDKRADTWAFGLVLFEMLTGRVLFGGGETISDTLASVMKDGADWAALLPPETPRHVRLSARTLSAERPEEASPRYRRCSASAGRASTYDLAPDGKRFAALLSAGTAEEKPLSHGVCLLNFFDEVRRKVGK